MKHLTTVDVPHHTKQIVSHKTCDLCGKKSQGRGTDPSYCSEWDAGQYEVEETKISVKVHRRKGMSYPDDSWGEGWDIDLCPECFANVLVPFLREKGAKIEPREY